MSPFQIGPAMSVPTKTLPHSPARPLCSHLACLLFSSLYLPLPPSPSLVETGWISYTPEAGLEFRMQQPNDLELPTSLPLPSTKIPSVITMGFGGARL